MSKVEADRPSRKPRCERAKRKKVGENINIRLTNDEKRLLVQEAGDLGLSTYVRKRLFDGGVRNRDALRAIAALHVLGRNIQDLAGRSDVNQWMVAETLGAICAAVQNLADDLDGAGGALGS